MLWKAIKLGALTTGGAAVLGGMLFGSDLTSYVGSSFHSVSLAVKENVPVEFQIRRARDLLDATGPEMQKNIRLIAEEEVDIASLHGDITQANQSLAAEKVRLQMLRDDLGAGQANFTIGDFSYTRPQLIEELAQRFTSFKEATNALQQKQQLLENREKALAAANQAMQVASDQRAGLQSEIDGLEAHYRLIQATAVGTDVQVDNTKLAQAEKVVDDVRRQLSISEHMLAEEAKFAHVAPDDVTNEKDLLTQVDAYLPSQPPAAVTDATGADGSARDDSTRRDEGTKSTKN
jgi:chromosome segregation ATPase